MLVRHGRTEWNRRGRFQGWADVDLDQVGRSQAADTAAELARMLLPGPVPTVLSSDLRRARDTATPIAAALGGALRIDPALREVDVGSWEGLTREEARVRFPDEFRAWSSGGEVRRGGGETLAEAGRRVADRIETELRVLPPAGGQSDRIDDARRDLCPLAGPIPDAGPGPALVVVGHGMALQAALGELRSRRLISFGGPAPHLANGERLCLPCEIEVGASS